MNDFVSNTLIQELWRLPLFLVYVVGILVSLVLRNRAPTAATCAAIGLFLLLLADAGSPVISNYIITSQIMLHWSNIDVSHAFAVVSVILNIIRMGAFVLILVAIFSGRKRAANMDFNTRRI